MKRILLLTTGGTIASRQGDQGLAPAIHSDEILRYLDHLGDGYQFAQRDLMDLDSSNIQPEEWRLIARTVYEHLADYDGIIITHGTDTMAYTASALSFMLQNLPKSVVFTGSQLPLEDPHTDALQNLYTAVSAVDEGICGVTVAFNRRIICGTRAVKVSTMGFDAFHSINAPPMAEIYADGMRVYRRSTHELDPTRPIQFDDTLESNVFLLKLIPGTRPEIFDALAAMDYKGIVLEAFGAGGLHYINRDLLDRLEMITSRGIPVVVCSQCLYERSDLSIYEVGQRLLAKGVIPGNDMTTEAAVTKLMWVLGQTRNREEIERYFRRSLAGESTV